MLSKELLDRLDAVGGMWTGEITPWGSYEILTPAIEHHKHLCCSPDALARCIGEWESELQGKCAPRIATWLFWMLKGDNDAEA
jgi:hypothetical protein